MRKSEWSPRVHAFASVAGVDTTNHSSPAMCVHTFMVSLCSVNSDHVADATDDDGARYPGIYMETHRATVKRLSHFNNGAAATTPASGFGPHSTAAWSD